MNSEKPRCLSAIAFYTASKGPENHLPQRVSREIKVNRSAFDVDSTSMRSNLRADARVVHHRAFLRFRMVVNFSAYIPWIPVEPIVTKQAHVSVNLFRIERRGKIDQTGQ